MIETLQAKILGGTALLLLILSFVAAIRNGSIVAAVVGFLFGALIMLLQIFDVNCTILGGCNIWGWIKTMLVEFLLLISIVTIILALAQKKKDTNTKDTATPATTTPSSTTA